MKIGRSRWTFEQVFVGTIRIDGNGHYFESVWEGQVMRHPVIFANAADADRTDPMLVTCDHQSFWYCRGKLWNITGPTGDDVDDHEETALRLKHHILESERELNRIRYEVEAFENLPRLVNSRRVPIPEAVRLFVWQRDRGRCTRCGNNQLLEFDHIIPFSLGGSSTERNIQLLCESCNRTKGAQL